LTRWQRPTNFGRRGMAEYRSHAYKMTLANMREKRLRDPAFWEYNAMLMRDPDFARISRNYAERLRNGK